MGPWREATGVQPWVHPHEWPVQRATERQLVSWGKGEVETEGEVEGKGEGEVELLKFRIKPKISK